jgi:hypothetical protein
MFIKQYITPETTINIMFIKQNKHKKQPYSLYLESNI